MQTAISIHKIIPIVKTATSVLVIRMSFEIQSMLNSTAIVKFEIPNIAIKMKNQPFDLYGLQQDNTCIAMHYSLQIKWLELYNKFSSAILE